ncbi:hypothetical protein [Luteibacter sp. RCC_6_2]|uniref:hypothetical protein n=1 Tax=Luteibacter sp. RCC_6_2 TaxID=3239223 RepID=UPI003525E707
MNAEDPFDIFSDVSETSLGRVVSARAVLVIRDARAILVPTLESFGVGDTAHAVEVYCPGLEKLLDSKLGGWVGGPARYSDVVEVTGVLAKATTRASALSLSGLSRMVLERDGEAYAII